MFKPRAQLIFLYLIFTINYFSFAIIIKNALICDNSVGHTNYVIPTVKPCEYTLAEKSSSCQAKIFNVDLARIPLKAYLCTKKIETFTSKMFFWGETSFTKDDTFYQPLSFQLCTTMFRNKFHPTMGLLDQSTPQLWNTNHKITPTYSWLHTLKLSLTNVYLKEISASYNVITRTVITTFENTAECTFDTGFCTTPTKIIIWQPNNTDICQIINLAKIHESDAQLHFTKTHILTRIDLPKITSSFTQFHKIDRHILKCFPTKQDKILQTYEGFILQLQDCSKKIKKFSHLKERFMAPKWGNTSTLIKAPKVSAEFSYLFNIQRKAMIRMESEIHLLECKQDNLNRKNMKLLSRLYPSHILSEILGHSVGATVTNDLLTEKSCISHDIILNPTLRLNADTFSTKPLANLTFINNSVTVQLLEENIWSTDMNFVTKKTVTGYLSFSIGNRIISYFNGELLQTPIKVTTARTKPPKLNSNYQNKKIALSKESLHQPLQSDSILAMEMALKTLQSNQQLNQYQFEKQSWANSKLTNSYLRQPKTLQNHHAFNLFKGILFFINILSQIWGTLLTAFAAYLIFRTCCAENTKKQLKTNRNTHIHKTRHIVNS